MNDSPADFARIEFTERECEGLRELRNFFTDLSGATIHRAGGNGDVKAIRRTLWEVCNNVGKHAHRGNFTPVDLTREQCDVVYDAALFVSELLASELQTGTRNLRAELFATVIIDLKAKATAATQLFDSRKRSVIEIA